MARVKERTCIKCKTDGQIRYAKGKYYKFILVNVNNVPIKVAFECNENGSLTEDSLTRLEKIKDEGNLYLY